MRVRPRRTPPPFLNAADQRRMLALVLALGLTVIAVGWAADPGHWHWIAPPPDPAARAAADAGPAPPPDLAVRLDPAAGLPEPGRVRLAVAGADGDEEGGAGDADDLAALPAEFVADAEDNTLGLSLAERAAEAVILAKLRVVDPAELAAAAEPVSFGALLADPDHYRGRAVTLTGLALGIRDLGGGDDSKTGGRVDAWFFPPTAGNRPVRAVANAAPGLPRGERLVDPVNVRVTGYFYKLQGYEAEGGLQIAPLVFAPAVRPVAPAVPAAPAELPWAVLGLALLLAAGASVLLWRWKAGDAAFDRTTRRRLTAAQPADLALPEGAEVDPRGFLATLTPAAGDAAGDTAAVTTPAVTPVDSPAPGPGDAS